MTNRYCCNPDVGWEVNVRGTKLTIKCVECGFKFDYTLER
jgi:hypothetical protein